jgi:hypothetical protein
MLFDIIKPLVANTEKEGWLVAGQKLNAYQKRVLFDRGWSVSKFTRLLFNEKDPILSEVVGLCDIIGVDPKDVLVDLA